MPWTACLLSASLFFPSPPSGSGTEREPAAGVLGVRAVDLEGRVHALGLGDELAPVVLVFLDTGCPISQRYAPRLSELARLAEAQHVEFFGVISDATTTASAARAYAAEYALAFPLLFDSCGDLAQRLQPTHVPEAFVVQRDDALVYRGRIDDRFEAVTKLRPTFAEHDLELAIRAAAERKPAPRARTEPVGCLFEAWSGAAPAPSYAREVAPILSANCVACHRLGDCGPFALTSPMEAQKRARTLAKVCAERVMPPWHAEPGFGAFRDARALGARQIATLAAWAEAGAPAGDTRELLPSPAFPTTRWRLGEPDLVVEMPAEFAVPAEGADIYRYFVVPSALTQEAAIVAVDFRPGNPGVVHHCLAYLEHEGWGQRMDARDAELGFSVFGDKSVAREDRPNNALRDADTVAGWAPGAQPLRMPKGLAMRLAPGGDFILEVHYHLNGKATSDRSALALYFAKEPVAHYTEGLVIGTEKIDIPPGEPEYVRHVWMELPSAVDLIDVNPHMHYLGRDVDAVALLPDGGELDLLRIRGYDFRWQNTYVYREPVHLPKGTRLDVTMSFDNSLANPANPSSPPIRVKEGWQTTDEMCLFYFTIVPSEPKEMDAVYAAMVAAFTRSGAPE